MGRHTLNDQFLFYNNFSLQNSLVHRGMSLRAGQAFFLFFCSQSFRNNQTILTTYRDLKNILTAVED